MRLTAATLTLAITLPASAAITIEASNSSYSTRSSVDYLGQQDESGFIDAPFSLLSLGSITYDDQSDATVSVGAAHSTLHGTQSLAGSTSSFTYRLDAGTETTAAWDLPKQGESYYYSRASQVNLTRFTTTEPVRVTLDAELAFEHIGSLSLGHERNMLLLYEGNDFSDPIFSAIDTNASFEESFVLGAGTYSLATQIWTRLWGTINDEIGVGMTSESASIDLTFTATTIPAPSATLLLPLVAATARRRRQRQFPVSPGTLAGTAADLYGIQPTSNRSR